ncbi:MAG: VOC family protein [Dehalococcoidia bacterium]|nr:VOC family protein [Dehalococcoidia bacterium]
MTARFQSKISLSLWLDGKAIEAAEFYTSLFPNSRMIRATEFTTGPAKGSGLAEFELEGQTFTAFDGIPPYEFTPALSLVIACDSQEEIDHFWNGFSDGGAPIQCGWIKDRFGVHWQVIPADLLDLMDKASAAVMEEMLTMGKIELDRLRAAADA